MSYTFDGDNKRIILSSGTTALDIQEVYSDWKEWVIESDNAKYLSAFGVVGGDPTTGGNALGATFFIENNWKIRPQEASHTLDVSGNLFTRDGSSPFVQTLGTFNVLVRLTVSNLIDAVATSGSIYTPAQIADEVMGRDVATNKKVTKAINKAP